MYGFSRVRRVNEDNVDLNRNFVDWDGDGTPANSDYSSVADDLAPSSWSAESQKRTLAALMSTVEELGFERRQQEWFDDVTNLKDGSSVSAELDGEWIGALDRLVPGAEATAVALEYDTISVLQALRADAVLHVHGDPTAPDAAAVRAQVRDAFCDDELAWLATCRERYEAVCALAVARLSEP